MSNLHNNMVSRFHFLPLFEKAIQYDLPATGVLIWRNDPTCSRAGTTSSDAGLRVDQNGCKLLIVKRLGLFGV